MSNDVTVVITNYKTEHLTKQCLRTLLQYYPHAPVVLIDNNSQDSSTGYVKRAADRHTNVEALMIAPKTIGHGPAMHKAIMQCVDTPFVFTLDSDCIVHSGGFIELMREKLLADPNLYALGWLRHVDKHSGVPIEWHLQHPPKEKFCAYVHPSAMMLRKSMYIELPPFFNHGAPCLQNMREAEVRGLGLEAFPIRDWVEHLKAGTRRLYGGRWDPRDDDKPGAWDPKASFPI